MSSDERETEIEKAFTGKGGFLRTSSAVAAAERRATVKTLSDGDVPHLGAFAEADHFRHLCRMVHVRSIESREPSPWVAALDKTRTAAMWQLMGNDEAQADAWARAYAESQRKAAGRFIRETERLT